MAVAAATETTINWQNVTLFCLDLPNSKENKQTVLVCSMFIL